VQLTLFESALESFNKASSLIEKALPFLNKGNKKADVELPQSIEDMMNDVLSGSDAASESGGEAVADIPMDDALATEQDEMEVVLPGEDVAEGEENTEEAPVKGKQKRAKKEKPARVKKEKPPRVKKVKPAKGQPEDGAEDAESSDIADSADSTDSTESSEDTKVKKSKNPGGNKLIPIVAVAVVILLLIPGNVLFVMNFLSGNDSGNENEQPQVVVPTPEIVDEPDEEPQGEEDEPEPDDTSNEDDPDENQDDDTNDDTTDDSNDDNLPQTETNIARLMGRRTADLREIFEQPINEKTEDGITVWSYGTHANVSLIIEIFNDRVFQITLLDDKYSIFGIEHGANIVDVRTHLIVNLGFMFSGDVEVDDIKHMTFMNLYNGITVMVTLVASEDGTVAEVIFTDMDVVQHAGV